MAKLRQFSQGHTKPAFSEKVQRGDERKFFKNRLKSVPNLKDPKSTLAQMALSFIYYALKLERLDNIWTQKAAPKVPACQCYGNLGKVTQNPHFLKKCREGKKGNFSKIAQKSKPRLKGPKALWWKWHSTLIRMSF